MQIAEKYFDEFGENQRAMAASVQSLKFCKEIIQSNDIHSILDSGSGLSSAFFHSEYNNVTTIDDSVHWADKTKSFISSALGKDVAIDSIDSIGDQKFDFVFYDYGNMETRIYYFKQALEKCKYFFYIDDMHVTYYREYIQAKYKQYRIKYLPETVDEFGRYGALMIKKPGSKPPLHLSRSF